MSIQPCTVLKTNPVLKVYSCRVISSGRYAKTVMKPFTRVQLQIGCRSCRHHPNITTQSLGTYGYIAGLKTINIINICANIGKIN